MVPLHHFWKRERQRVHIVNNIHSDALRRHELVHKRPKRSSLGRGARACSACAIARRKCSGGNPCEGCVKRSIECVAHSNTATSSARCKESFGVANDSSYEMAGIVNDQAGERSTSPQSQSLWPKIISPITQPQINPRSSIGQYHQGFGLENIDGTGQQMTIQNLVPDAHQRFDQFTSPNNQTSDHTSEDARRNSVMSYDHQSTPSSILPLHSLTNLGEATNSFMNRNGQASSQLHVPDTSLSDGLQESASSWTQYNPSSINWLPYDWAPDYQLEDDTSSMRIIGDTEDINGPSPLDIAADSIPQNLPYSINNATIFTPSSQRQGRIQMDNSPRPTLSSEGAPTTPGSHKTQSTGRYYVDGHGSRLPHVRKTPSETHSCPLISHPTIDDGEGGLAFPANDDDSHYYSDCKQIPQEIYNIILDLFKKTCVENSPFFAPFHHTRFPSLHLLSRFIAHYIDSFHQTLPFIHLPSFDTSTSHWLFLLAMAAVGSHYHRNGNYAKPMHEFLRRAITSTGIKGDSGCSEVVTVQIKLLNCVGMMYCGCDELSQAAKSYHRDLVDFCCYEWKASNDISSLGTTGSNSSETDQAKVEWKEWYDAESIRRTGYCIWVCILILISMRC